MKDYDIIITGGGISGSIAAIAAARMKKSVLLVEQNGYLGGMLTAGGVGPMMTFHAGQRQVIRGITGELVDRLIKKGKSPGHIYDTTGFTWSVTPFDAEALKHELEIMLLESGGEILFHTMLAGVEVNNNRITQITVCNKAGLSKISGCVFIDATGDADLSAWSGVECKKGRETDGLCQPMTMNLKMRNVDTEKIKEFIKANPEEFPRLKGNTSIIDNAPRLSIGGFVNLFKGAREKREITFQREELLIFETNNQGEFIVNTSRILAHDGIDPWSISNAEIEGRRQTRQLEEFLISRVPGFENSVCVYSGPSMGVRSTRQIQGLYILTCEDILNCKKFSDAITHSGYPVDIHSPDGEGTICAGVKGVYSIPYRCLVNDKVLNLITVGRCISATFEAQAAIRLSPTAGGIGHAGGVAASIAADEGVDAGSINIQTLQNVLRQQGAYLEGCED